MAERKNGLVINMPQMKLFPNEEKFVIGDIDMESSAAHKDLSVIDFDDVNKVLTSTSPIADFNSYKIRAAERIWNAKVELLYIRALKDCNTHDTFIRFTAKYGFPELTKPEEVIDHMNKKMAQFTEIIKKYKDTIGTKYKDLGITVSDYKKMLNDIENKKYTNISSRIFTKLLAHKEKWKKPWGADFRQFNGGLCFCNYNENIWDMVNVVETLYNTSLTNDVIVFCHGTNVTPGHHLSKSEIEIAQKIDKILESTDINNPKKAYEKLEDQLTESEKQIVKKYGASKLMKRYALQAKEYEARYYSDYPFVGLARYYKDRILGDLKRNWGFGSPLDTPYGVFRDVNELIRECIRHGHKKIKIMACNPGHYSIAKDIRLMTDVVVDYQYYSVLIESGYWDNFRAGLLNESAELLRNIDQN